MKRRLSTMWLLVAAMAALMSADVGAVPLDLTSFTLTSGVTVNDDGSVSFNSADLSDALLYDPFFHVQAPSILSFNLTFTPGEGTQDYFDFTVIDPSNDLHVLFSVDTTTDNAGIFVSIDLSPLGAALLERCHARPPRHAAQARVLPEQ